MNFAPTTLRGKLIGVFLLPTLLIVVAFSFITYFASRQGLEDELGKRLVAIATTTTSHLSHGVDAKQIARIDATKSRVIARFNERLKKIKHDTGVNRLTMFTPTLTRIADSDDATYGELIYALDAHRAEIDAMAEDLKPRSSVLFATGNSFNKIGFAPVVLTETDTEPTVVAYIAVEGSASYFSLLNNLASLLLALSLVGVIFVILTATVFSSRITGPVRKLVAAAQRLGRGEYEKPVEGGSTSDRDEIGFLTHSFEEMRRDIIRRDEQMKMMLSGIAHEVRNPLGGMQLFCGLLQEDVAHLQGPREQVAKIQKELGYLQRVVTDFLDFARNVPIVPERFDAAPFASELSDLLLVDANERNCDLRFDVEPGLELTGDREKIRRALINVVRNAVQACDGSDARVVVSFQEKDDDSRDIVVEDNGPGISDDDLEQILTPFFTTKEKGSGLGLALTRRIIEEHDGRMEIESRLGEGTKIVFNLPFNASIHPTGTSNEEIPEGWLG